MHYLFNRTCFAVLTGFFVKSSNARTLQVFFMQHHTIIVVVLFHSNHNLIVHIIWRTHWQYNTHILNLGITLTSVWGLVPYQLEGSSAGKMRFSLRKSLLNPYHQKKVLYLRRSKIKARKRRTKICETQSSNLP